MGSTMEEFLDRLPREWKAITALSGAFFGGITVALFLAGFWGVPEQVAANTVRIDIVEENQRADSQKLDRALCLLEILAEEGNPLRCAR